MSKLVSFTEFCSSLEDRCTPTKLRSPSTQAGSDPKPKTGSLTKTAAKLLTQLEESKCAVSILPDFNLLELFKEFDVRQRNLLDFQDFELGLGRDGLEADPDFFKTQDWDNDGFWLFSDFCEVFLPNQPSYARLLLNRIPFPTCERSEATQQALKRHWQLATETLPWLAEIKPQLSDLKRSVYLTEDESDLLCKYLQNH